MKNGFSLFSNLSVKEQTDKGLMDGPGTYGRLPWKGSSKDASGTAAEDTISLGSGDRVSGADRMGMEVHWLCVTYLNVDQTRRGDYNKA
jgi:hypothetical protein